MKYTVTITAIYKDKYGCHGSVDFYGKTAAQAEAILAFCGGNYTVTFTPETENAE